MFSNVCIDKVLVAPLTNKPSHHITDCNGRAVTHRRLSVSSNYIHFRGRGDLRFNGLCFIYAQVHNERAWTGA